jgi:hypothetical protein
MEVFIQPVLYLLNDKPLELSPGSRQDTASLYGRVLVINARRQRQYQGQFSSRRWLVHIEATPSFDT